MKTLKDFFYNINDIVVALVIVALAAFIIFTRTEALMSYGSDPGEAAGSHASQGEAIAPSGGAGSESEGAGGAAPESGEKLYPFSVYIDPENTVWEVGMIMESLELFASGQQFVDEAEAGGYADKIGSGTYIIPQGSTHEEVFEIITGPGL